MSTRRPEPTRDRRPRIYVDLDDVLAETARMFLRVLARDFGRQMDFDDLRTFHLGQSMSLDEAELAEFLLIVHEADQLADIDPMPGAIEVLVEWVARGYEIFVVTGRPEASRDASLAWLEEHSVPYAAFHFLDKYSHTYGDAHPVSSASLSLDDLPELDFCLAIEDFAGITPHLAGELGIPVALLDRPWNRLLPAAEQGRRGTIVRCLDWVDIQRRFPSP